MTTGGEGLPDMESTIKVLSSAPSVLTVEDVDDFCQLAAYYSDRTPASFRRDLTGCFYNGAMVASASKVDVLASELAQSFCLKISIPELLLSSQPSYDNETDTGNPQIRYFVVDCRLAQQYNEGHLLTAFHLDATLMLREPAEFDAALHSLFTAQEQAIQAGSVAGGEHLCFIGSGNEEEDQYMYMVVANLLQKRKTYISVARGGYQSLFEYLADVGIDLSEWLVGSDQRKLPDDKTSKESGDHNSHGKSKMESIFRKMAGNVMEKSHNFKEKVAKFMESTDDEWSSPGERSAEGKSRKEAVFSIADDDTEADCDETTTVAPATTKEPQVDALQRWKSRADFRFCFECQAVECDGQLHPGWLLVTDERLYCLVAVKRRGWVRQLRPARLLRACARITSRRSFPELITFKFADPDVMTSGGDEVVAADRYILPHAGDATREIKRLIVDSDQRWQRATSGGDDDVTEAVSS